MPNEDLFPPPKSMDDLKWLIKTNLRKEPNEPCTMEVAILRSCGTNPDDEAFKTKLNEINVEVLGSNADNVTFRLVQPKTTPL